METKKAVIAASAALQPQITAWRQQLADSGYTVPDWPKPIPEKQFTQLYPGIYKNFFASIAQADLLFVLNADKNDCTGYIGPETFAELSFGLVQKQLHGRPIELVLLQMPGREVTCYEEIALWLQLGWIRLHTQPEAL